MNPAKENPYTKEARTNLKYEYFCIKKQVGKCDCDKGKEAIQSHLSWKIGPLHIFFIILMNPAKENPYTEEAIKKYKVWIFLYSRKSGKMWLW